MLQRLDALSAAIRRLLEQARRDLDRAKGEICGPVDDRLIDVCESLLEALLAVLPREAQEEGLEEKTNDYARTGEPELTPTAQLPRLPTE